MIGSGFRVNSLLFRYKVNALAQHEWPRQSQSWQTTRGVELRCCNCARSLVSCILVWWGELIWMTLENGKMWRAVLLEELWMATWGTSLSNSSSNVMCVSRARITTIMSLNWLPTQLKEWLTKLISSMIDLIIASSSTIVLKFNWKFCTLYSTALDEGKLFL